MIKTHQISPKPLTWELMDDLINSQYKLELSKESVELISKCRNYLDAKMENESTDRKSVV